jgi:membrane protein DedA with SNARE-associated domain
MGTLCALGYFNPFLVYPIMLAGDLIPDTILFYVGRRGKRAQLLEKYGPKIGLSGDNMEPIQRMWDTHPRKMMAIAKLALGLATPFLISAGLAGIKPRIFYGVAIPVALVQHIILLSLGFYFGHAYEFVQIYIGHAEFLIISVAIFGGVYYAVARGMKRRFLKEEQST